MTVDEFDDLMFKLDKLTKQSCVLITQGKWKAHGALTLTHTKLFDKMLDAVEGDKMLRARYMAYKDSFELQ